jgi:hypothetical protein
MFQISVILLLLFYNRFKFLTKCKKNYRSTQNEVFIAIYVDLMLSSVVITNIYNYKREWRKEIMATSSISKKIPQKKSPKKVLAATTLAGLLAACNSDSDSTSIVTPVVTTTNLSGAVVKGPLSGALVYADSDGDGIGDGSPITTGADGSYTISATNANATIIAMSGPDTIDTSSGEPLTGITLKAPAGSTVVTPATTILEAQPNIEPAQLAIALGIPTTAADGTAIDIMSFNPYAAGADPAAALAAEKAAQQVMVTIKAVSAAAEGAGMNVEDAFEQAMASVAEVVSVEAEKIDVSSTASIAAAEATMATTKVDFSDSTVLEAVSTAVQTKVVEAAAADATIVVDTTAFAAVLETAVTAVVNVNAAIEAITDTDLSSTESMGTFATLTDVATEIKAAAEAEVAEAGSGAALVTFTDAAAVTEAVVAASAEIVVEQDAATPAGGGGAGGSGGGTDDGGAAAAAAAAEAAAVAAEAAAVAAEAAAVAAVAAAAVSAKQFKISDISGASWDGPSAELQALDATFSSGRYDVTGDIQVAASDFTAAFDESSVDSSDLGTLSITNFDTPKSGFGNDLEVTIVIDDTASASKITVGFTIDWSMSGDDFTFSSDDSTLDISVIQPQAANTALSVQIANVDMTDTITLAGLATDTAFSNGQAPALNLQALGLIAKIDALSETTFDNLEARFAVAGKELDVSVDVSNLNMYYGNEQVTSITSTIDIV